MDRLSQDQYDAVLALFAFIVIAPSALLQQSFRLPDEEFPFLALVCGVTMSVQYLANRRTARRLESRDGLEWAVWKAVLFNGASFVLIQVTLLTCWFDRLLSLSVGAHQVAFLSSLTVSRTCVISTVFVPSLALYLLSLAR